MSNIEALIAQLEGGGGAQESGGRAKPIGIPDTFQPYMYDDSRRSVSGGPAPRFVPAPYYDGAEYAPRNLSAESRARLQNAMAQAGLIGKNDTYRLGVWDETSIKAYKKVLAFANQGGIKWQDALDQLLAAPQMNADGTLAGAGGLAPDPGRVQQTTNRLTLEEQVQATARERLGRKLKQSEVAKFVSLYQGMEGSRNASMAKADENVQAGGDVTVEDQAPPGVAADQYMDANFAQEEAGQSAYGYLGALKSLLGG